MKNLSRRSLLILGIVFSGCIIAFLTYTLFQSKAVRSLPRGATEIQEYYEGTGMSGDFSRLLKARIAEEDLAVYARKVGAVHRDDGNIGLPATSWSSGPAWFNPKNPPKYSYHEQEYRILVGWEDGFVYLDVVQW